MHVQNTLIIGAGLTGLSCARRVASQSVVVERGSQVGGLARTFRRGAGYLCDCTGHWLHFSDQAVKKLVEDLLPGELLKLDRRAAIYSHGRRTPYPFQANTHGLPLDVAKSCLLGYFRAREAALRTPSPPAPSSFEEFIRQRMGDGIAEHFMIPYNTKLWTVSPADLDPIWCGRFVPVPQPEEVVDGALSPAGAGHRLGYNAKLYYPAHGGIGILAERMRTHVRCDVRLGVMVTAVDWRSRRATLSNGDRIPYNVLVSTMPLPDLVSRLCDPPDAIVQVSRRLRAISVTYWDVGVARENGQEDSHWTYFPESDVPFYRVGSASAVLSSLAPRGHRSYYVEVSHPRGSPVPTSDDAVVDGLRRVGLLGEDETPLLFCRNTIDCAYALMDHAYGEARSTLLSWLESQRILSVGRYGGWVYDSMENAIKHGHWAAERVRELS